MPKNSYNSGVSGNNTLHSIDILLNKAIPLEPDIVVLMQNINDLIILLFEGDFWNHNPYRGVIVQEIVVPPSPLTKIKTGISVSKTC